MPESTRPTIQIKTASSACPDIVGDWAACQKNPNESVKYLIIQLAAYFGNVDIFDRNVINQLNVLLSNKEAQRIQPVSVKTMDVTHHTREEPEIIAQKTRKEAAVKEENKTKRKGKARPGTELTANVDIFDMKFMNTLQSMFNHTEAEKDEKREINKDIAVPAVEKAKTNQPEAARAASGNKRGEKPAKKKVSARPGTAPNIMQ